MLTAHHLYKSYSIQPVLKDISFSLNPGEHVGLIGPNGCGKTTLVRILAGLEKPDEGVVTYSPPGLSIGYLAQGFEPAPGLTIDQAIRQAAGDLPAAEAELERLALALSAQPNSAGLQGAYDEALRRVETLSQADGGRAEGIRAALGLREMGRERLVSTLSGGQKTRLSLALVLLSGPQLLLLDEPTNHLDIEMLEWLEGWLAGFQGGALIVSHDRTFLDRTASRILDFDPESHSVREYAGNYSEYLEQYLSQRDRQLSAYKDQVYEIRRMKQDINRTKQQALNVELTTTSRQPGVRRYAKKVARKALSREKKLDRYLESDERVDRPREGWQMKTDFFAAGFGEPQRLGQDVLELENVSIGYPGNAPLLTGVTLSVRAGRRVAITGPNGAGKTTLRRTIAGQIEPQAGTVRLGASVRLGYMSQEQELLDPVKSALETIQAETALNETDARMYLHFFLFAGDDALRPARELSYGERARLALARLVAQGCNLLLLDEPINHLDIPSRARFEQSLEQFRGAVLAVVHDRYFIERFADEGWVVSEGKAGNILN